jgi:4-hydroxybenzoate polyprenyltransferase
MAEISSFSGADAVSRYARNATARRRVRKRTPSEVACPLNVDLDGTLIRSDLLIESAFAYLGRNPLGIFSLLFALFRGKAALKARIASATAIDVSALPYDEDVMAVARKARDQGRPVYLVSASNERYVSAVANHVGLFDGWLASSNSENLTSAVKASRLVSMFGEGGFDYVGNDEADLAVWQVSRERLAVRTSSAVRKRLLAFAPDAVLLAPTSEKVRAWAKLLRVHQWAKNGLVAVPLLTSHSFELVALGEVLAAILCFCLAASSIYILNDLVDIEADRAHPTKHRRPLAAGNIPVLNALLAAPLLLATSLIGAFFLNPWFAAVLVCYVALTTAYTFLIKRKMMADVIALAALYTIRVIGGAVVIATPVSEWLLAFSMFMFTSLALIKRYVELATLTDADLPNPTNRNYQKSDLYIVAILAMAAAFNAITVFALYISSDAVKELYRHPQVLWFICPILMYWLGRIMMLAHRRLMNDDPVLFALKDWNSLVAAGLIGAILVAAT